jgi:hypothetical protein
MQHVRRRGDAEGADGWLSPEQGSHKALLDVASSDDAATDEDEDNFERASNRSPVVRNSGLTRM